LVTERYVNLRIKPRSLFWVWVGVVVVVVVVVVVGGDWGMKVSPFLFPKVKIRQC
jgi:hypothetical protein